MPPPFISRGPAPRRDSGRPASLRRLWVALSLLCLSGCGDASFILVFRSGTVASSPSCTANGGAFDLRESSGLTILVVFASDDVVISPSGAPLGCGALRTDAPVDVSGFDSGTQLDATEIVVR